MNNNIQKFTSRIKLGIGTDTAIEKETCLLLVKMSECFSEPTSQASFDQLKVKFDNLEKIVMSTPKDELINHKNVKRAIRGTFKKWNLFPKARKPRGI